MEIVPTFAPAAREFFRDLFLGSLRERLAFFKLLNVWRLRTGRQANRETQNYQGGSMLRQITARKDRRGVRSPGGKPLMWRP